MSKNYSETKIGLKKINLSFLLLTLFFTFSIAANAVSYTWNTASGAWTDAASWNPARTTPAVDDVLIFDGSTFAAPTVTGIVKQTIGQLSIINNAAVTFSTGVSSTGTGTAARAALAVTGTTTLFTTELSVGDYIYWTGANTSLVTAIASATALTTAESGTVASAAFFIAPVIKITGNQPGLNIPTGSSLTVSATTPIVIFLATGATGTVTGNLNFSGANHKIDAADASGLTFNAPAILTQGTGCAGNMFSAGGTASAVVFNTGSKFIQLAGSNPIALTSPATKVVFNSGSTFSIQQNAAPSFSGRTYSNFDFNFSSFSQNSAGGSAFTCDNLSVTAATLVGFNLTGAMTIKGNISVATGTLSFIPASGTPTITFGGTGTQTISNSAILTFSPNITLSAPGSTLVFTNNVGATLTYKGSLPGVLTNSGTFVISTANSVLTGTINAKLLSGSTGGKITAPAGTFDISGLTLNVSANTGYNAVAGDKITLITGPTSIIGTPSTVTLPTAGSWHLDYSVAGVVSAVCDLGTSINPVYSNLNVSISNGTVSFNSEAGKTIEVYNSVGQKLLQKQAVAGLNTISVSAKGVLLVKVDNRIAKVIL